MKKILFLILLLGGSLTGFSQDLIVTTDNDSIPCEIIAVENDFIFFKMTTVNDDRKLSYPLERVTVYKYNYFLQVPIPQKQINSPKVKIEEKYRLGIGAGYAYRLAKIPNTAPSIYQNYLKGLKSGYHINIDFAYYISEYLGIGLKASFFQSKNKGNLGISNTTTNNTSITINSTSDNQKIIFIGPSFATRFFDKQGKNALIMNLFIGYIHYRDDYMIDFTVQDDILPPTPGLKYSVQRGGSIGGGFDIAYDIRIIKGWFLSLQGAIYAGVLTKYKDQGEVYKLTSGEYIGLGRCEIGAGVKYHF